MMTELTRPARQRLTARARLSLFLTSKGCCALCRQRIHAGQIWHLDHVVPLALGGTDEPSNLQVLCKACHRDKTRQDIARAAKAYRLKVRHTGAALPRRKPLPCGRRSPWKKTLDGRILLRQR